MTRRLDPDRRSTKALFIGGLSLFATLISLVTVLVIIHPWSAS